MNKFWLPFNVLQSPTRRNLTPTIGRRLWVTLSSRTAASRQLLDPNNRHRLYRSRPLRFLHRSPSNLLRRLLPIGHPLRPHLPPLRPISFKEVVMLVGSRFSGRLSMATSHFCRGFRLTSCGGEKRCSTKRWKQRSMNCANVTPPNVSRSLMPSPPRNASSRKRTSDTVACSCQACCDCKFVCTRLLSVSHRTI